MWRFCVGSLFGGVILVTCSNNLLGQIKKISMFKVTGPKTIFLIIFLLEKIQFYAF